jgi:hypothetical protein
MIDHGYVFDGPNWTFTDAPLAGLYHRPVYYESVRSLDDFQPWLDRIVHFPEQVFDAALRSMPSGWIGGDHDAAEALLERLFRRRQRVEPLLEAVRGTRATIFPNWRGCPRRRRAVEGHEDAVAIVAVGGPQARPFIRPMTDRHSPLPAGIVQDSTGSRRANAGSSWAARRRMSRTHAGSTEDRSPHVRLSSRRWCAAGALEGRCGHAGRWAEPTGMHCVLDEVAADGRLSTGEGRRSI